MSTMTDAALAGDGPDANLAWKVREAQVRQTYTQMVIGAITNPIGGVVMTVGLWPVIPHGPLLVWFAVLLLIQLLRFVLPMKYRSIEPTGQAVTTWSRLQIMVNGLSGLVWGSAFFVLWPSGQPQYQLILPVIVIGLSAGATAGYAPIRASHMAHILLSLVPLIIRFFAEGSTVHVMLALLASMYILTLYRIGHNLRRASTDALTTSFRYQELAATLAEEKAKTEALNAQLQQSEARFRALSEATFEAVAIHEDGIAVDVNRAATQMFGYTEDEAIGMHIFDLLLPASRTIAIQHVQAGYEEPYEAQGIRKDGTIFPLEIQGKSVPYKGGLARVVAARDITGRKQAEEQALRLQLEHERVQILTSFFQNASHEFRTPLATIRMTAYLLDHADSPGQRQAHLDQINNQVDRITKLVDSLLLMVRLDSGVQLALKPVDVNDLLRSTSAALDADFPGKQLRLTYELEDALPPVQGMPNCSGRHCMRCCTMRAVRCPPMVRLR